MDKTFEQAIIDNNSAILDQLFLNDSRLKRTVPSRGYDIDKNKLSFWIQNQCSTNAWDSAKEFKWLYFSFETWKKSLASAIGKFIHQTFGMSNHSFRIAKGNFREDKVSAKERWVGYIFRKLLEQLGFVIYDETEYWYSASMNPNQNNQSKQTNQNIQSNNSYDLVFVDDFNRNGSALSNRIIQTPLLAEYLLEVPARKLYIISAVSVDDKFFKDVLNDTLGVSMGRDTPQTIGIINSVIGKVELIAGTIYNPLETQHIIFDHRNEEKEDPIVYKGYIYSVSKGQEYDLRDLNHCRTIATILQPDNIENNIGNNGLNGGSISDAVFTGSLIQGSDQISEDKFPPPLYQLEFGNGTVSKTVLKLKFVPGMRGIYVRDASYIRPKDKAKQALEKQKDIEHQEAVSKAKALQQASLERLGLEKVNMEKVSMEKMEKSGLERIILPTSLSSNQNPILKNFSPEGLQKFNAASNFSATPKQTYKTNPILSALPSIPSPSIPSLSVDRSYKPSAVTKASKTNKKRPVETWSASDVEAFCDNWLEEEDPEDDEGITAFLDYASREGLIDLSSADNDVSTLCQVFRQRQQIKKEQKKQQQNRSYAQLQINSQQNKITNPIQASQYKSRQDLEKEEMDKLIKERARQDTVRKVWDDVTQKSYNEYFLKGGHMAEYNAYRELMLALLNEEFLHPTNDYKQRWEAVIPR